jgi:nicotinate-nucleotide pyrophosphorylase (carboxylating)
MLDNMDLEAMKKAVEMINKRALIEASGNVTLDNILEVAGTGVDYISVGALTHSSKVLDLSMKNLVNK